jgi:hypothetical protein
MLHVYLNKIHKTLLADTEVLQLHTIQTMGDGRVIPYILKTWHQIVPHPSHFTPRQWTHYRQH